MALVCVCFCPKSFNILHCRKLAASWSFNLTEQRVSQLRSMTYTSPAHISQVVCNLFSFTSLPAACQTVFCSGTGMISLPDAIFVFDTSQEQILQESTWLPIYINESMPGRPLLMRHYNSAANELQMTLWSQIWINTSLKQFQQVEQCVQFTGGMLFQTTLVSAWCIIWCTAGGADSEIPLRKDKGSGRAMLIIRGRNSDQICQFCQIKKSVVEPHLFETKSGKDWSVTFTLVQSSVEWLHCWWWKSR